MFNHHWCRGAIEVKKKKTKMMIMMEKVSFSLQCSDHSDLLEVEGVPGKQTPINNVQLQ